MIDHSKYRASSSRAGVAVPGYRRDVLESEEGYSPFLRTVGIGAAGAAAYQTHKYYLQNSSAYAQNLYRWAMKFEELTPNYLGVTFGLSERASSYVVDSTHFRREQLFVNGELTELGAHFQRILGHQVDVSAVGGLHFSRRERGDPFLYLDGRDDIKVRFAKSGRFTGSSFRYHRPLEERPINWSRNESSFWRTWENYTQVRHSQEPKKFNLGGGAKVKGFREPFVPWYAAEEAEAGANFWERSRIAAGNLRRSVGPQAFELLERPQSLLADIGLGLKQGSYNKLFHVPGFGEGGLVNNVLLRRALPIAAGVTALRYLDYKTGHHASNALIDVPLRANVLRADLTDSIPGMRSMTDWYQDIEGDLPQYAPLALPLTGMFAGGLIHMGQVARGRFHGRAREARLVRSAAARVLPRWSLLKQAAGAESAGQAASKAWKAFGTPGKGALIGLALMLPLVPGMIGSRKTGDELRRIYSGEQDVPVRQGRWWEVGSTPWSGTRITAWRPHASVLLKSHAKEKSLYGSEENYWAHSPWLHPLRWLKDPYYLEREQYEDRPYPITSPAFSNVPLIGPALAATLGKAVKPVRLMHEDEWDEQSYTLYSTRLEPRGPDALPAATPQEEFSLWHGLKREIFTFSDYIGLPGWLMRSAYGAAYPKYGEQPVYLQGSRQMTSTSRGYYERNLGAGMFVNPELDRGFMGYTEPLRRFVQPEGFTPQVNEIANRMPSWMPGEDYLIDFRKGDPYIKVDQGYARLPGAGYAALHPELEDVDPEDYPDITKLRILGDVAPYSREYQRYASIVRSQAKDDAQLRAEYERIAEQVRQTKASTIQVAKRHFNAPVETLEGTVKSASADGIELAEYPGRVLHFSSISSSMADLVADELGRNNRITAAQAAKDADKKADMAAQYLADVLAEGTHIKAVVPKGATDNSADISAVILADNTNINRELIHQGYAVFRSDLGGAEQQAMHGRLGRLFGEYTEELFFQGDQSPLNPMRYLPTPFLTKYGQERTALSQYIQQESVGTRMRRWERPIHDMLAPWFRGLIERTTGINIIPEDVEHRRDLDTLADMLQYLRAEAAAGQNPKESGRYTSQAKRTNIGANLYGSSSYVGSTLPSREARYFRKFVEETDPDVRERILDIVPDETRQALIAQWQVAQERIEEASGAERREVGSKGRPYTEEDLDEYRHARTKLELGDYLRSRQIARFFFTRKFRLPDSDSEILDENLDYQDVKLKIVQLEGYDAHDFNLFDDRSSVLWRKPYVDGAVRELTSGDSRSQEQMRQSIERIMLNAGAGMPDVRYTTRKAHRSRGNVRVDAHIDSEQEELRDMRRNPERYAE